LSLSLESKSAFILQDFLWYPEVNGSMRQHIKSWTEVCLKKNEFSKISNWL